MSDAADLHGRFVVVPAAYVYLVRADPDGGAAPQVLLQERRGTGYMDGHWAAGAAGHVEKGETVPAAARRETVEELGVDEVALRFVTTMQRRAPGAQPSLAIDERVDFFFIADAWRGTPRVMEGAKSAGLGWFGLDALPEPVVPHERAALELIAAHVDAVGTLVSAPPAYVSFGFDPDVSATPAGTDEPTATQEMTG